MADQHRIDWRRRLMKILPRDRLERLVDAEKRPHAMDRRELEETVVLAWDDVFRAALALADGSR
jgi:hypothetical protein